MGRWPVICPRAHGPVTGLASMTRLLAYRVVPELAALWLIELLGLFVTLQAYVWPFTAMVVR